MKKILLSVAAIAAVIGAENASAQNRSDQTSIRVAGYEVLLNGESRHERIAGDGHYDLHHFHHSWSTGRNGNGYDGHIGFFEIGFGGFRATPSAYAAYPAGDKGFMDLNSGKSIHIGLNIFTASTSITRNNTLGVTAGIGLAISNFSFETPRAFTKNAGMIYPVDAGRHLKKSKLNTVAVRVPLALEVNPTRDFFFSIGGYADLMIGSSLKWKAPKEKLRNPYTNFLQAGVTARAGFRHLYAFANYGLVEMFEGDQGPVVSPYTFGLGFGF